MSEPDNANRSAIILARWSDRFIAWLIDAVILTILASALLIGLSGVQDFSVDDNGTADITSYTVSGAVFFAYFIAMEYRSGQTIGKKILNIRLVGMDGREAKSGRGRSQQPGKGIHPAARRRHWVDCHQRQKAEDM